METWQVDFYRLPVPNEEGETIWELVICRPETGLITSAQCPQAEANSNWLAQQLQQATSGSLPDKLQVFRPQSQSLVTAAAGKLGLKAEATRRTPALKEELRKRAARYPRINYDPVKLEQPPPQALPDYVWGEEWRFANFPASDLVLTFSDRPIPICDIPPSLEPVKLGLASTVKVPGVVIYGGRQSLQLARWLQEAKPFALNYIPTEVGKSGGLVLEAGLVDRWIIATFEDEEVAGAARNYEERKQGSQGLHFLVVQPDDSGITTTGFWLLQTEVIPNPA